MAERTEAELARTLKAAAELAPLPDADLALTVAARRRQRRQRRLRTLLAAACVVVAIGTGTTVAREGFGHRSDGVAADSVAATSVTATPAAPSARFAPAAQVWPEAVFRIPVSAPDGAGYRPVAALSSTEVLLSVWPTYERMTRLDVYDRTTGTTTELAEVPTPPAGLREYQVQGWDADSRMIIWFATAETPGGEPVALFWAVPRRGGRPFLVHTARGADAARVDRVAIAGGDRIAWSLRTGGVYAVPLGGGDRPEPVPGAAGLHLRQWPWAGDRRVGPGDDPERNQTVIVNLETGERRAVQVADDMRGVRCGATWCAGERYGDAGVITTVVQRHDGAERRELTSLRSFPTLDGIVDDRFAVLTVRGEIGWSPPADEENEADPAPVDVVYDHRTGVAVAVGDPEWGVESLIRGASAAPNRILYWSAGPGRRGMPKSYWVLNLAAVP